MRAVIQRVSHAEVSIDGSQYADIKEGLLILLGVEDADQFDDIDWLCKKIVNMRIFSDDQGLMNKSLMEVNGEVMVISQFTLYASTKKGNRPSFIRAAKPEYAQDMYNKFLTHIDNLVKNPIKCGVFAADMKITLMNDGPVTIIIDSKSRE